MADTITYFEDLTGCGACPHADAFHPDGKKEFYRVVKHDPATSECFFSHRKKNPTKVYAEECEARAVSLSETLENLKNSYFRTPAGKRKTALVGLIVPQAGDGMLKQTFGAGHFSLWRSVAFNPTVATVQSITI